MDVVFFRLRRSIHMLNIINIIYRLDLIKPAFYLGPSWGSIFLFYLKPFLTIISNCLSYQMANLSLFLAGTFDKFLFFRF